MAFHQTVASILRGGGAALMSLLFPAHCGVCGFRLSEEETPALLCGGCREKIGPLSEPLCTVCSHPMAGLFQCPNCEDRRWHLSMIVAAARHEGVVRELIHRFKYGRDQSLVRPLAQLLPAALEDPRIRGKRFDAIVPVPLHSLRERERGFNQSALLASRLAKQQKLPLLPLLRRTRRTAPQARFDRHQRMENLEGAFALHGTIPEGSTLLLVDDVTTTGATFDACAAILIAGGAAEVCAVSVAR
jgi:ComF family protein